MAPNKAFAYKAIPNGVPIKGKDLVVESTGEFDPSTATAPSNGLVVKNLYASYDPALRGQMRDPSTPSYAPAFKLNNPVQAVNVVAEVLKSQNANFTAGDFVALTVWPVELFSLVPENIITSGRAQLINNIPGVPLTAYVGALGMSGMTAYGGFHELGQPKKGETIFISAASGAVGQVVGQIAIREGLKVIGSVGDEKKLRHIEQLGMIGFNYKKEDAQHAIKRLAPDGLDIYWDNVGGPTLDAALAHLKTFGRIIACGSISNYNSKAGEAYRVEHYDQVWRKRLQWRGFLVVDPNIEKHRAARNKDISKWLAEGSLVHQEHIVNGIDNAVDGFLNMLSGQHLGKSILKIQDL